MALDPAPLEARLFEIFDVNVEIRGVMPSRKRFKDIETTADRIKTYEKGLTKTSKKKKLVGDDQEDIAFLITEAISSYAAKAEITQNAPGINMMPPPAGPMPDPTFAGPTKLMLEIPNLNKLTRELEKTVLQCLKDAKSGKETTWSAFVPAYDAFLMGFMIWISLDGYMASGAPTTPTTPTILKPAFDAGIAGGSSAVAKNFAAIIHTSTTAAFWSGTSAKPPWPLLPAPPPPPHFVAQGVFSTLE